MKLKYYLRGLGTGIATTALILGISSGVSDKNVMTDEEILARAKQLGLVERTVLSDMVKDTDTSETEETKAEETKAEETKAEETKPEETKPEETVAEESETEETVDEGNPADNSMESEEVKADATVDNKQEEALVVTDDPEADTQNANSNVKESEEFGMPDEAGTVTITIVRGDSSDSVSRLLEEVGLVDSATAYDKYLCQNGYDKSIRTGNYEIPADATGEEIAKLITGR